MVNPTDLPETQSARNDRGKREVGKETITRSKYPLRNRLPSSNESGEILDETQPVPLNPLQERIIATYYSRCSC